MSNNDLYCSDCGCRHHPAVECPKDYLWKSPRNPRRKPHHKDAVALQQGQETVETEASTGRMQTAGVLEQDAPVSFEEGDDAEPERRTQDGNIKKAIRED